MERQGFIFYKSFAEAIAELGDPETELQLFRAIVQYGLTGTAPQLTGAASACFKLIRPQLDANQKRWENGIKGGRPKTKTKPNRNQNGTTGEPKEKEKEKENENVKEKEKDARANIYNTTQYKRVMEQLEKAGRI